ncbi:unnamed protein product [Boreogadus saida]
MAEVGSRGCRGQAEPGCWMGAHQCLLASLMTPGHQRGEEPRQAGGCVDMKWAFSSPPPRGHLRCVPPEVCPEVLSPLELSHPPREVRMSAVVYKTILFPSPVAQGDQD